MEILANNEKVLIFSTWTSLLEIMHKALGENKIVSLLVTGSDKKFFKNIEIFQTSPDHSVLLLPTKFACNGLNLVEASHVIFINSTLMKVDELQAIGRIYRIGQKRQTHVHKFLIENTIEQIIEKHTDNVYHKHRSQFSEFNDLTVPEFLSLFI